MSQHRVNQLRNYLKETCKLQEDLALLEDSRLDPDYSTQTLGGVFVLGFTCRSRSLRQLERRARKKGWRRMLGLKVNGSSPVEGTLRYFLPRLATRSVHAAHVSSVRRMLRSKQHSAKTLYGLRIGSLDGHQPFSTQKTNCPGCILRHNRKPKGEEDGPPSIRYEHKIVTARLLGDRFSPWLGYISQDPQPDQSTWEGEQTAILRLLTQIEEDFGAESLDAILVDSLHVSNPFLTACQSRGWDAIFISKGNASSLQIAFEERDLPSPVIFQERVKEGWVKATVWRHENIYLGTCSEIPLTMHKVHQKVETVGGELVREDIRWLGTTMPAEKISEQQVWWIAWRRWESENGGHRAFKQDHHAKHVFCHKSEVAVENIFWLLMWAQNLLEAFGLRRLNSGRFGGLKDGLIGLVEELVEGMATNSIKESWEVIAPVKARDRGG